MTSDVRHPRVLFIAHEAVAPPGYLEEAARRRGMSVDVCRLWDGETLPRPDIHSLIVPLGSEESAYDDTVPWLAAELAFLRAAVAAGRPVFGVCFGAQVLARATGGRVARAARPEIGWVEIDSTVPSDIGRGPWLEWHFDGLTPPPGAQVLATSSVGVQAYQLDRQLGVQFHPEVTPRILEDWIAGAGQEMTAWGVDVTRLHDDTLRREHRSRRAAHHLFDRVLARLQIDLPR